jgi:general secretion pathway protein K
MTMLPGRLRRQGQRGVAIITALLLTTLAVTIVASLFWQQQVQVRSMENQRLHLQTEWIVRGALDWAGLILRQDGLDNQRYTAASGVWATPLAETRLDDYIERERVNGEKYDATLSGQITDAQSRYNLNNLAVDKTVNANQLKVFQRLLDNLHIDASLASKVADEVARSHQVTNATQSASDSGTGVNGGTGTATTSGAPASGAASTSQTGTAVTSTGADGAEPMVMLRVEDLLTVAGFTPQAIEQLRDFVIVLPEQGTLINVNTAPAELLAALVQDYSVSDATTLVNNRKRVYYRQLSDFTTAIQGKATLVLPDVKTSYFLVFSRVRLDRAALDTQALIYRNPVGMQTKLEWIREN